MATATTTLTVPEATQQQPLTLKLAHHDASYLPISRFHTIDGVLKSHAAEPEQTPLICYPKSTASDFELHTGQDLDQFTDAAVQFYVRHGIEPADPAADEAPVIALLATSSFDTIISFFALNRLGWTVLFLSTRLTAPAYARLLDLAGCHKVIVPASYESMVDEIKRERSTCEAIPILQKTDYRNVPRAPAFERKDIDPVREAKKMAWILHSSGSTGFPKPIFLTNTACLANFRKSFGLRAFCISPLFHSHGLMEFGRAFYTRAPIYIGNHSLPVTSQNLIEALRVAQPQQVSAVPYVIQLLAEKNEGVQALARAKLVLFAGSSCPQELGDRLVANGVNLVANYGSTETGQIMTSFRSPGDTEWQYMRLLKPAAEYTLMDEIAPGVFECVGLNGLPSKGPSNSKPPFGPKNPENSFRTADLFTRHPDPKKSNYYKYLSRLDDRITLVNGEKLLPIPFEGCVRQDELVREAVMFGFQRTVPGLLVFRSNEQGLELSDEEYLDSVFPTIEAANLQAESFSRVPRDMVVVKGVDVHYPRTDKGTFIRAQVYQQFADDISKTYDAFEKGVDDAQQSGLQLDVQGLEDWLLNEFSKDFDIKLPSADADIFSAGVDSLQTTRLWRAIKKELDLGSDGTTLSQNIVFEKGTIKHLARHLYQLRTGEDLAEDEADDEIQVMRHMIDHYSTFVQHCPSKTAQPSEQVVLVTGATGNLGAFLVAELVRRPDVSQIWTPVRSSSSAAGRDRVISALQHRHIHLTAAEQSKLFVVSADLSNPDLGLGAEILDHLLDHLTCIIHSAWAVNFNLGVRSFEQQHIRGTQNLINLCLRSRLPTPAKFYFCSSVSAASGTPKPALIAESAVEDLRHAQTMGYGRSKLVAEHMTHNAMRTTAMTARVLRIGQLSGDTRTAQWNETEAIALLVRSALTTGVLPALDERPSWLPVDVCAQAIVELASDREETDEPSLVYHLVNPHTFSFSQDFLPALQKSPSAPPFQIADAHEWLEKLAQSDGDAETNPSIKLLDFWKGKYGSVNEQSTATDGSEAMGLTFDATRTLEAAPSLRAVRDPVSDGLIERYVEVWMKKWTAASHSL